MVHLLSNPQLMATGEGCKCLKHIHRWCVGFLSVGGKNCRLQSKSPLFMARKVFYATRDAGGHQLLEDIQ